MNERKKRILIIGGPTAAGKSALAIRLAQYFDTQILSADSRQCYREMKIGVARPSDAELAAVPHAFIASHSIHKPIHAADFEAFALAWAEAQFLSKDIAVVVGGTGLYLKALTAGLDFMPQIDPSLRAHLQLQYATHGVEWLQEQIRLKDPAFAEKGEIQNPHRMLRALEVLEQTGKSIQSFKLQKPKERNFEVLKIAVTPNREELYARINHRVDIMLEMGLLAEVESLFAYRDLVPLQTVGYQEYFDWMKGLHSVETATHLVKQHSRNYAKRQLTWFRGDAQYQWFEPTADTEIIQFIQSASASTPH